MKKHIAIGLLLICNIGFISSVIYITVFSYRLIVRFPEYERGIVVANDLLKENAIYLLIGTFVLFTLNYFLIVKSLINVRPLILSLIISIITNIICIPMLLSERHRFIQHVKIESERG